ncbi:MAG TPA: (2Fe-2S)-binding protein [bacterium]
MFICVCKAVRAAEIDAARGKGMRSWEEVAGVCGAGTECGACQDDIDARLRGDCAAAPTRTDKPSEQSAA